MSTSLRPFNQYLSSTIRSNRGMSGFSLYSHWKIYQQWKRQFRSRQLPLDLELPWITVIATDYLKSYISRMPGSDLRIFEYGSGGSSLFFLKHATLVVSVEHDKNWFELVKSRIRHDALKAWEGQLIEPEPLDTSGHIELSQSNPHHYFSADDSFRQHTFKNYARYIDIYPDGYFDIILIDGRSRPSCLYHSLDKVKLGGLLVLDNAEREYYLSEADMTRHNFKLVVSANSALNCSHLFTQTNIYLKEK